MSKETLKALVIEDDQRWRRIITKVLISAGHEVALEAVTLSAALEAVKQIERLGIDVILLDGNLDFTSDGSDAQVILQAIRELNLDVTTLGMGGLPIPGVDLEVGKNKTMRKDLKDALAAI